MAGLPLKKVDCCVGNTSVGLSRWGWVWGARLGQWWKPRKTAVPEDPGMATNGISGLRVPIYRPKYTWVLLTL